jgi:putative transcriptional regulator
MSAHPESSSLAPTLLLSMPQMQDENFDRTVVLLCDHTADGAFGLVLNRPTTTAAAEAVAFDPPLDGHEGPLLWMGGPVEPQRGWILLGESVDGQSETEVAPGLYLSTSIELLRQVIQATPPRARVLTGYAGWGPGQLDDELDEESWIVEPALPEDVFTAEPDELWASVLRRKGGPYAVLALMPPDPSLN